MYSAGFAGDTTSEGSAVRTGPEAKKDKTNAIAASFRLKELIHTATLIAVLD
jgi:hypothetical protein